MWPFVIVALLLVAFGALGVLAVVEIPRRLVKRALRGPDPTAPALEGPAPIAPRPHEPPANAPTQPMRRRPRADERPEQPIPNLSPRDQSDLLRYPRQLELLELQILTSHAVVMEQLAHLAERLQALSQKEGRSDLAVRYQEDIELLQRREAGMRRVLGLLWKARAVLTLRAHLAGTARLRPTLPSLPDIDDPRIDLEKAATAYEDAAARVSAFLRALQTRALLTSGVVPPAPELGLTSDDMRAEVQRELAHVVSTHNAWETSFDRLRDTLTYLADRCDTRRVARGTTAQLGPSVGGEALLHEVEQALGALSELSEVGDRRLADLAVQNLAEDVSNLERAGLETSAEAEATLEVARLLEGSQGKGRG